MNILPAPIAIQTGLKYPGEMKFQTSKFHMEEDEGTDEFDLIAQELSLIMGRKVTFHKSEIDNDCAVWGRYGWFVVR